MRFTKEQYERTTGLRTGVQGRRGRSRWIMLAVLAMILAACGGEEAADGPGEAAADGDAGAGAGGDAEGCEASPDEDVGLTVWFGRETYVPEDGFESFRENYAENVTINYEVVDLDDVFERLSRMQAAGQKLPDVIHMDGFFMPAMYEAGIARDISACVELWEQEDPEEFNALHESYWEHGQWDGTQVAMADVASMDQIWYRPDWFSELGIDIPETQNEVLDAMSTISEEMPEAIPWSMQAARGEGVNFLITHLKAVGVEFDGATPMLDSEAGHYLIDWYQTIAREGWTSPDVLAWGSDEYRGAYIGGNAAMMMDSIGVAEDLASVPDMNCDEQWALYDIPVSQSGGGADGETVLTSKAWTIASDSEYPYEASLVLRYIASYDQALSIALIGDIPKRPDVLESAEFQEEFPCFVPHIDTFLEAENFPLATDFFQVQNTLELMVQDMIENPDTPPEELAAKWQAELDAI